MTENYFTPIKVASTEANISTTNQFMNINSEALLAKLRVCEVGKKDGSHFLRTTLKILNEKLLNRKDENTENFAHLLVIDADKSIDRTTGEQIEGSPPPDQVHQILRANDINHVIYGSYSHYEGSKGNRYRILVPTTTTYSREELAPTIESLVSTININLNNHLLCDVKENHTWSQPWYYPRKPNGSKC